MFSAHSQVFTGEMGQKKRRKCLSQAWSRDTSIAAQRSS